MFANTLTGRTCSNHHSEPARLHQRYLYDLLLGVFVQWACPPPGFRGQCARAVLDLAEPPEGARMLIVGDTHGQLADVLWIFAECKSLRTYGAQRTVNIQMNARASEWQMGFHPAQTCICSMGMSLIVGHSPWRSSFSSSVSCSKSREQCFFPVGTTKIWRSMSARSRYYRQQSCTLCCCAAASTTFTVACVYFCASSIPLPVRRRLCGGSQVQI